MKKILVGLFVLVSFSLGAQEKMTAGTTSVKSIDGILNKAFEIISGGEGKIGVKYSPKIGQLNKVIN